MYGEDFYNGACWQTMTGNDLAYAGKKKRKILPENGYGQSKKAEKTANPVAKRRFFLYNKEEKIKIIK